MFLKTLVAGKTIPCRSLRHSRRCYGTVSWADPSDIRNIALLAHIDSGKTTLTESILHTSSYLTAPGSVDTGSTTTDFLPAERERGITIQSASIPVHWKKWKFNLIDTPGHADFGMEVESASRVIDGAVVLLDAVEGVEGQTMGVWRQLDRHSVPTRMIFMNKLDRTGASFHSSILSLLDHRLHPKPVILTLPIASFDPSKYNTAEPGIEGIVDLVNWEVWKWKPSNESTYAPAESVGRTPLPLIIEDLPTTTIFPKEHPMISHLLPARIALIDNLCDSSPALMESFLDLPDKPSPYLAIPKAKVMSALRSLTLGRSILPILCGAALKHVGTEILLNYVGELLASPVDVASSGTKALVAGVKKNPIQKKEQLQVLAWKVSWDKRKGWMTFVRVYSGTLQAQSSLLNTTNHQKERVSKVLQLYASQHEEVDTLSFGGVGVVLGLKHTRTGDTLTSMSWNEAEAPSTLRSIIPPPSVISASIIPHSRSDVEPVQEALLSLARTDPSLRITEDVQEGQTLVHGLGALHLEIVEGRLRDEWGVKVQFGKRRVTYRENFVCDDLEEVAKESRWEKDVGGKHVGASLSMTVRALREEGTTDLQYRQSVETWGGNSVRIRHKDGELGALPSPDSPAFDTVKYPSTSPIASILQGISSTLTASPHTLLPLSYLDITIASYTLDQGSPPSALTAAAADILRNILLETGPGRIMEPFVRVKVDVGEETLGKVVKDLTEHGGEILDLGSGVATSDDEVGPYPQDGLYIPPKWLTPSSSGSGGLEVTASIKRSVHAVAPLARMLDYSSRLRAVSGGQAVFEMSNAGYRPVGDVRRMEILREIGRL